jgi:hypothetical protein
MVRRRSGPQSVDTDFASALEAMSAPELRAFARAVLDELENEQRARVVDSLMTRAVKGHAGWKPNRPSSRILELSSRRMRYAAARDAAREAIWIDAGHPLEAMQP